MDPSVMITDIPYRDFLFRRKHYEKFFQHLIHIDKLYFL